MILGVHQIQMHEEKSQIIKGASSKTGFHLVLQGALLSLRITHITKSII